MNRPPVVSVTRAYTFSASHRLHVSHFSEEENSRMFGKCNNPYGHGHNYTLFVTARGPVDPVTGLAVPIRELDGLVNDHIVRAFHNKHMNAEIPAFATRVATTENLAEEIRRRLQACWKRAFPGAWPVLEKLRIYETDRNIFELNECA